MKTYTGAEILVLANKQRGRVFTREESPHYRLGVIGHLQWKRQQDESWVQDVGPGYILAFNDWHFVDEEETEEDKKTEEALHAECLAAAENLAVKSKVSGCRTLDFILFGRAWSDYTYERVMRERG